MSSRAIPPTDLTGTLSPGETKVTGIDDTGSFPKFILQPDAPPLTSEQIAEAREDW